MMKVSELASAAQVSRDTVRHYTRLGLIKAEKDQSNGYHLYDHNTLLRIRFIKLAQGLGFRLDDIEVVFVHADRRNEPCPEVQALISQRLSECAQQLQALTRLFNRMQDALEDWQSMPDHVPTGYAICRLIESQALDTGDPASE